MTKKTDGIVKRYLDINVLQAARERILEILYSFDEVIVSFSGGKDSLAVLWLTQQIYEQEGVKKKLKVHFRDEELIPDDVVDFVQGYYKSSTFDFKYFCLQLESEKMVLGRKLPYIQWDANREHIRPMPDFAISSPQVFNQYNANEFEVDYAKHKICILTGIRASESLTRLNAIKAKKNLPHIAGGHSNIYFGRVIYDWDQPDVFKYFYDYKIPYCKIYDKQIWNGDALRVSTPLHAESAKRLHKMKTLYPVFYDQMARLFPDIELQARYYTSIDTFAVIKQYPKGWDGIFKYINDNLEGEFATMATNRVFECMRNRSGKEHDPKYPLGLFPIQYVFKKIIAGEFKRTIPMCVKPNKEMFEYEQS